MAIIKCKMCGGDIELASDKTFGTCEYCGSSMTFPKIDDDQRVAAFNRGNHFRRIGEFDKALAVYERIVREDDTDAEAHWCCALCRFGIEYVEDPATYEYLPTCHRVSFDSFLEDVDYLAAVEHSDGLAKRQYQKDGAKIAEVQRGILATSQNADPFDIFICYKESDENKERTQDSLLAQDIYYQLTDRGYRVFFSRITLEDMAGKQYEPYIFAALNSAKVMVVVGTKAEYLNAVWVKNEWSRFLAMMKKDRQKLLLPCYRDMDPYDMPEQLAVLQSYDMSKIGFIQDLIRGIKKILDADKKPESVAVQQVAGGNPSVDSYLKRVFMFLEDGDWKSADDYCEKVLDIDPENARAYLGKLMAELQVKKQEALAEQTAAFDNKNSCQKVIRFADDTLRSTLEGYIAAVKFRMEQEEIARKEREEEARIAEEQRQLALEKQREEERLAKERQETAERIVREKKAAELKQIREKLSGVQSMICTDEHHTGALRSDGTVLITRYTGPYSSYNHQPKAAAWKDVVALSGKHCDIIGLLPGGSLVRCYWPDGQSWQNVAAISAGHLHTVGLRPDGTVVAVGRTDEGQCNVTSWRNIAAVSAGYSHTVGLRTDGTVVAVGCNDYGQCNTQDWKDVVSISADRDHTVGVKADGTVVAIGNNCDGRCDVGEWRDIVSVSAGINHTIGLQVDGTVVAVGRNDCGQCNIGAWRNIVAISAGYSHTVGLRADGSVVATEYTGNKGKYVGQCDVKGWKLFDSLENLEEEKLSKKKEKRRKAGLCQHCGGELKGFFSKKCVSCGRPKDY